MTEQVKTINMTNEETQFNEEPLLSLAPGLSVLAPPKPLLEMTDAEITAWHTKLRDHKNPQTMMAHLNALSVKSSSKVKKTTQKPNMNEFV
jgi:hypothetical protein